MGILLNPCATPLVSLSCIIMTQVNAHVPLVHMRVLCGNSCSEESETTWAPFDSDSFQSVKIMDGLHSFE